jgi:hypothetical protein
VQKGRRPDRGGQEVTPQEIISLATEECFFLDRAF